MRGMEEGREENGREGKERMEQKGVERKGEQKKMRNNLIKTKKGHRRTPKIQLWADFYETATQQFENDDS